MFAHPILERANLVGRILRNFSRGDACRIDLGRKLFESEFITQTAANIEVVTLPGAGSRKPALVDSRHNLRPLRLSVLLPRLHYRYDQSE